MLCVNERSWKVGLPAPPPLPSLVARGLTTPQDQLRTSISSLCFESSDSPLMSPIFAKMSGATADLPRRAYHGLERLRAARAALSPCTDPARRDLPSRRRAGAACA